MLGGVVAGLLYEFVFAGKSPTEATQIMQQCHCSGISELSLVFVW